MNRRKGEFIASGRLVINKKNDDAGKRGSRLKGLVVQKLDVVAWSTAAGTQPVKGVSDFSVQLLDRSEIRKRRTFDIPRESE